MSDIVTLARRHKHVAPTHYEGCEVDHIGCLVNRMADEIEGLRAENKRLREALEGIRIDGPDADGLVWATIQHPAIAVRSHVMVGNMERLVSQAFLEFEQMRRKALGGKP